MGELWPIPPDDPFYAEQAELQRVRDAVIEKGFTPGREVRLLHLGMTGVIVRVDTAPTRLPIHVRREDDETFAYGPDDMELRSD